MHVCRGGFGTVYEGSWRGFPVAVKKFEDTGDTKRLRAELENEGYIMSLLHHPYIVRFYGIIIDPEPALVLG
jgi:serine/threonine protein kinase